MSPEEVVNVLLVLRIVAVSVEFEFARISLILFACAQDMIFPH